MDERREYYEGLGGKSESVVRTILGVVSSRFELGDTLDVGCGDGVALKSLQKRATRAVGIDVSEDAVILARVRAPHAETVAASVEERLPFSDASFDSVLMLDVIEHLSKPLGAIHEIGRVLRPGGILVITTPNANSPVRLLRGRKWFGLRDPAHVLLFTSFTLRVLLERSGFRVASMRREAFTGTILDPILRALRFGGTLLVLAEKA